MHVLNDRYVTRTWWNERVSITRYNQYSFSFPIRTVYSRKRTIELDWSWSEEINCKNGGSQERRSLQEDRFLAQRVIFHWRIWSWQRVYAVANFIESKVCFRSTPDEQSLQNSDWFHTIHLLALNEHPNESTKIARWDSGFYFFPRLSWAKKISYCQATALAWLIHLLRRYFHVFYTGNVSFHSGLNCCRKLPAGVFL